MGKIKLYPDFLILDQTNQKIIIWEHFGMTNDKRYKENGSLDIAQNPKDN